MSSSSRGLLVPYLSLVAAGLGFLNWWQANTPIDTTPIVPIENADTAPIAELSPARVQTDLRSLSELSETTRRPLFRSDRKPPASSTIEKSAPAPEAAVAAAPASADTLRLIGMMRSGNAAGRALIRVAGLPNAAWVEVGGEVGGWTVGKIEADRVLIERNGDRAELKLFAPNPAETQKP